MVELGARARTVLRKLGGDGRMVRDVGGWKVGSEAVEDAVARELVRHDLVEVKGATARISAPGRAYLEREAAPESPNRWLVKRMPGPAKEDNARLENLAESPLAWLMRRRMISSRQFEAGERLRVDFMLAGRAPSVTMRWAAEPAARVRGPAAAIDPTTAQIAAKQRFEAASAAAGTGLKDVLWRVVCMGEGLETAERALGWPARAGKVVLGLALDRLAEHYLGPHVTVLDKSA